MTKFKVSWKINGKTKKVVGRYKSFEEAQKAVSEHIKSRDTHASPYYRIWSVGNIWTIDYGKHNAFYKIERK
ncbi:hypothetical protein AB6M97_06210 [Streptococcus hillyeri]|uniref:hypothetical protein n=1 Tax=Streptococcus hillyeri TaxID=2282420 RepID=UPI0034E26B59